MVGKKQKLQIYNSNPTSFTRSDRIKALKLLIKREKASLNLHKEELKVLQSE